jgi:peptide-methionine (S)-S-oxide reductase
MTREIATLGGGCFWCLEAVFERMQGVEQVESGYMGGESENPTYREVCSGATGHAEVVQVVFDPDITDFESILGVFYAIHDPTTLNRQGNDVGTQYRSVIFYHSEAQRDTAVRTIARLEAEGAFPDPVVTELAPATTFYKAEDYHQEYFRNNPQQPYCAYVVAPKVKKFLNRFGDRVKAPAGN